MAEHFDERVLDCLVGLGPTFPAKHPMSERGPLNDVFLEAGFPDDIRDPVRGTDTTRDHTEEDGHKGPDCVSS